MNEYTEFRYLHAPRPKKEPIPVYSIPMMERLGYVAQKKKNGTCSVIFAREDQVIFKTRHLDQNEGNHRAWAPKDAHLDFFKSIGPKWNVFAAELLHNKGPAIKDELFIFDVMVLDGEYLVGSTFEERMNMLQERFCKGWKDEGDQYRIHRHVTLAKVFTTGFKDMFNNLGPLDEGLVFKLPRAKLLPCVAEASNMSWAQKCRHPKAKTYSF